MYVCMYVCRIIVCVGSALGVCTAKITPKTKWDPYLDWDARRPEAIKTDNMTLMVIIHELVEDVLVLVLGRFLFSLHSVGYGLEIRVRGYT